MKKKRVHKPITVLTTRRKHREVRDLYNRLRRTYKFEEVYEFFRTNYFLQPIGIDYIIARVDNEPLNASECSAVYRAAMDENFKL